MTAKELGNQQTAPILQRMGAVISGECYTFDTIGGLTKREEFAKTIMVGLMANNAPMTDQTGRVIDRTPEIVAKAALVYADALLAALAADGEKGKT